MDPFDILVLEDRERPPIASCRRDARALEHRGHRVRTVPAGPDDLPIGADVDVVLAFGWRAAAAGAAGRCSPAPLIHVAAGPATDLATGGERGSVLAAYDAAFYKIVDSAAAQREILLGHGGRCWIVPPGAPALSLQPREEPRRSRPLLAVVLDPYDQPIDWVTELFDLAAASDAVELELVDVAAAALSRADVAVVPSRGEHDGLPSLVLDVLSRGIPVLMCDVGPLHALASPRSAECFLPVSDPAAVWARLSSLTAPEDRERLGNAGAEIRRRHTMPARLDALEATLAEIVRGTRATIGPTLAPAWFPGNARTRRECRYTFAAQFARAHAVLDLGCGDGAGSIRLADAGASRVLGLDRSEVAVARARSLRAREGIVAFECMAGDALELADDSFDLVVAFGFVEALDRHDRFVAEVERVLTQRGALLISLDNPSHPDDGDPGIATDDSALHDLTNLLESWFGRVNVFAERTGAAGFTIRGDVVDPRRDTGWIVMASRPQRVRLTDERKRAPARSTSARRRAA